MTTSQALMLAGLLLAAGFTGGLMAGLLLLGVLSVNRPAGSRPKPRTGPAGTGPARAEHRAPHHVQPPAHPRYSDDTEICVKDARVKVPVATRPVPVQSPLATRRQP